MADRRLRSVREPLRDLERALLQLVLRDAERDEADALRLSAVDRLAEEQVVLRLGQAAKEWPDDRGVVARGNPEPRVPVDEDRKSVV